MIRDIGWCTVCLLAAGMVAGCYDGLSVAADGTASGGDDTAGPGPSSDGTGNSGDSGDPDDPDDPQGLCAGDINVGPTALRRLTRNQYDNTIRDLLGLDAEAASRLDADERVGPFTNNSIIPVSERLVEQYMTAAEELSTTAVENDLAGLLPCDPAVDGEEACARSFIETFGRRAFRRPLTAAEVTVYEEVYALGATQAGFSSGIQLVLEGMLESPSFLYMLEFGVDDPGSGGETVELDGYELASRLSFFLWNSTPDDALLDAAQDLRDPDALEAQARRMLEDPRARQAIATFHTEWVGLHGIDGLFKDPDMFPDFDADAASAMEAEVGRFAEHVIFEDDGRLETLLTANYSLIDEPLFGAYGLDAPAAHDPTQPVALDETQRSGLLTQLGFLAVNAHHNQTSPVHRGVAIRRNFLCQELPAPPPDVDNTPPPPDPESTTKERFDQHVADPACAPCHLLIDPVGLAFEHYDPVGAWRTVDGVGEVDASGELLAAGDADGTFYGAVELGQVLSESTEVRRCVTQQWFRFAFGRSMGDDDSCAQAQMYDAFEASDFRVVDLLVATIKSPSFRYLRVDG